jgi:RimJ/RimL family protein N-acetyltransferase
MQTIPKLINPIALAHLKFWRDNYAEHTALFYKNKKDNELPFDYKNLPDTNRLHYELMTWDNFQNMLTLFHNDPNPFVSNEFKTLENVEFYAVSQLEFNRFSHKRGACDWFLRDKVTHELVGVLHLYELNTEYYNGKHPACVFGYSITEKYRAQGYAYEAATHLLKQIPLIFKRYEVKAISKNANTASCQLLKKLGFKIVEPINFDETLWYKVLSIKY